MSQEKKSADIPEKYLSPYKPEKTEDEIYAAWEKSGFFNPDVCVEKGVTSSDAEPFSMALPPPNVTGTLHMGHAFEDVIQDIVVRFERMWGKKTLWLPGTDHAAIATEAKVVKKLQKEGLRKTDLSREEFLKKVDEFAKESHDTIVNQVKKMGASLDWSREAYTLDDDRETAVRTAFKKMHEASLIYRGYRVVNWDPKGQTTISDDEIVYEEQKGKLYTFKYSKDFPIPIATTRPETKLGDTAVAVHPDDSRYKKYIGKNFEGIDFAGEKISLEVIADDEVDPEFGTGAVGVTPAHSYSDWEIAQRHDLQMKQIINEYGKMDVAGPLNGLKTKDARERVVEWLKESNLLEKIENIDQNISTSERTGAVIEPLPKMQWFVDVNKNFTLAKSNIKGIESGQETTLKEIMKRAVEGGQVQILPKRFEKVYYHWIDNLHDWCISRQLWFGHRVPVWYKGEEVYVGMEEPEDDGWEQDPDTLDTWFSSGLWTFSTLGWPKETKDLRDYHPTSLINPGYEILFFWVARMILFSGFLLGEIPFKTAFIHGIIRDKKGQKFSKSLGNGIDPLDVSAQFGTDALRMTLAGYATPGQDGRFYEEQVKAHKHFANKVWNIARFVLSALDGIPKEKPELAKTDQQRTARLEEVSREITSDIESYRLHLAAEKVYHYVWHEFADVILEEAKPVLADGTDREKQSTQWTLFHILRTSVKLLHPFMPFITEEIWKDIKRPDENLLMVEKWPYVK